MSKDVKHEYLDFDESIRQLHDNLKPKIGTKLIETVNSVGETLAERINSRDDVPPFNVAFYDGYALRSEEAERINTENFADLLSCEKEKAELNMIVDLERNDLARICRAGTRKVVQKRTIESYPTVFHAVATVAGELAEGVGFCGILKAMFPGGSITGAPKVSSMEIINELEPSQRGVYTGSIGFIGVDGNAGLNIAIRTIIIKGKKAYAQVGGGIVMDSGPEAELDETLTKARALLAGINSVTGKPRVQ